MSEPEATFIELGKRLVSAPSLPENIAQIQARVSTLKFVNDARVQREAAAELGREAVRLHGLALVPQDLRDRVRERVDGTLGSVEESGPTATHDNAPPSPRPKPSREQKPFALSKYAAPAGFILLVLLSRLAWKVDWTTLVKRPTSRPSVTRGSALPFEQEARLYEEQAKRWARKKPDPGPPATSPPSLAQRNVAMLEATQKAWASMQAIDAEADNADFGDYPSKGARQIAYAYSQLPLANVDPAFVQHIRRNIDVLKKAAATLDRIEAKRDELDAQEGRAADIGAALGAAAAASDGASPQQAAGIRDFLGLMAAASTSGARSQFENECAPILQQLQAEADALDQAEAALAEHLSQKYGVPFIDPL